MTVLDATAAAIDTTLRAGTALTALLSTAPRTSGTVPVAAIYEGAAPDGATLPYVVYQHQGGGPDSINPSDIESNLWTVKCYSGTSAKAAAAIFEQVDTLLHKRNLTITGGACFWCAREINLKLVETTPAAEKVYMTGGIYRIRTTGV